MAKFTIKSTKHNWNGELSFIAPTTTADEAWDALVGNVEVDVNTLALKAYVIEAQRVCRDERTLEAAQTKLDLWRYKGGKTPQVMDLQNMEFTQPQLDALLKSGTKLTNFRIKK